MQKRGVSQEQFNWILITIAGAIILLFFVSLVYKQKGLSEEKSDIEIQKNLQSILTGAEISKQTENIISVPEKEIKYSCEGFSIGALSGFNPRVVFSPDLLKSSERKLILYSLEWRVPFRITNFLYVTSSEVRYVIVDDNDNIKLNNPLEWSLGEELYNLLPEKTNKELVLKNNLNNIQDKNNYKIKIIFFNNFFNFNLNNIRNTKNEDISVIDIYSWDSTNKGSPKIDEYGKIDFYEYATLKKTLEYLKKESIIAAVFSENADIYNCNMEKAMTRLKKVYDVYDKRVEKLKNDEKDICKAHYDSNLLNMNNMDITFGNFQSIYNNLDNIEHQNQIVALHSCALIY